MKLPQPKKFVQVDALLFVARWRNGTGARPVGRMRPSVDRLSGARGGVGAGAGGFPATGVSSFSAMLTDSLTMTRERRLHS